MHILRPYIPTSQEQYEDQLWVREECYRFYVQQRQKHKGYKGYKGSSIKSSGYHLVLQCFKTLRLIGGRLTYFFVVLRILLSEPIFMNTTCFIKTITVD